MKLAPIAGHVSRLTPEAAWAAAWIEAQSLVTQLQAAIARGDIPLRNRQLPLPPQGERLPSCLQLVRHGLCRHGACSLCKGVAGFVTAQLQTAAL